MSSTAQYQFAAEFVSFLAAAAGAALVLMRGELLTRSPWGRLGLGAGFGLVATASFLSGSLLLEETDVVVALLHGAGLAAALSGTLTWAGGPTGRALVRAGLGLMGLSLVARVLARDADSTALEVVLYLLLGLGSGGLVAGLLAVSRRSVAARVAASAAGTLLVMVLVLSVALSSVLSSTVEDEAVRRLDARASTEASLLQSRTDEVLGRADFGTRVLASPPNGDVVLRAAEQGQPSRVIDQQLEQVSELFQTFPVQLGVLSPRKVPLGRAGFDDPNLDEVAGTSLVDNAITNRGNRSSVAVVGDTLLLLAASPIVLPDDRAAVVVAATVLDDDFLAGRASDDETLSLALHAGDGRLAALGPQPEPEVAGPMVERVLAEGQPVTRATEDRFVAARPVPDADGRPAAVVVASTPATLVADTRDSLYRTLFLIALGGTLLALLLAAVVGDRIGGGLRRLTDAAVGLQGGDLTVRAGVDADDEVGVLGRAFDSMASSIQVQTEALREAADAETRLRNRLEAVVGGMGEALVAVDGGGRITDFNQAAEELTGRSAAEARGRPCDQVVALAGDDGRDLGRRLRRASPSRWSATGVVTRADRATVPVAVTAGVLRGPAGDVAGNVFVFRDLRREREVERMKTEFLSRVGHELRTPLTSIIGFAEIMVHRDVPPATATQWHEEIIEAARRQLRIVEMLELFASSGAGRMFVRREPLNIRTVVEEEVAWWQERLEAPWSIARKVARTLPLVQADRRWVRSSLHELIDNAVKFSPDGGAVTVKASAVRRDGVRGVELAVTDKGRGMTPEEQTAAFGEFTQGDTSDTRSFGGLGLGLPLVQRVAESHGGEVRLESEPGKGSTFSLFIPVGGGAPS